MGSFFDELKKVKQALNKANSDQSKTSTSRAEPAMSAIPNEVVIDCPVCHRRFVDHKLKKHLERDHQVPRWVSLDNALKELSSGKRGSWRRGDEKESLASTGQKGRANSNVGRRTPTEAGRQVVSPHPSRGRHLKAYETRTVTLPSGEKHTYQYRKTVVSPSQPTPRSTPANNSFRTKSSANVKSFAAKPSTPVSVPLPPPSKPNVAIAKHDDFKMPEAWVGKGTSVGIGSGERSMPMYMGIDFGTAYTKASVGFGTDDVYIVDWKGVTESVDEFTLPGEFSVLPDGQCVLGRSPIATRIGVDLKLPFLEGSVPHERIIDATIFLALIMQYIRGWWFHHHTTLAKQYTPEWMINVGAPTTPWHDSNIRSKYLKVASAAWVLSCLKGPITVDHAKAILHRPPPNGPDIEIVPEFVAQIASYTRSPQRQRDLHLLVDIGAGTVDVVTFNVHKDDETDEDVFPIFCASVSNLGTHYLMSRRMHLAPKSDSSAWLDTVRVPTAKEVAAYLKLAVAAVSAADNLHTNAVAKEIKEILRKTKSTRYRRSQHWNTGVRVFVCGGGSKCEVFSNAILVASKLASVPLSPLNMPLPRQLKANNLPNDEFHRVSVAYGLGINPFNLGMIRAMNDVDDDTSVHLPLRPHNTDFEDK